MIIRKDTLTLARKPSQPRVSVPSVLDAADCGILPFQTGASP